MAREMALAGVDRSELTPPPPPQKPQTLEGKWQNFWYHYKVPFVAGLVIVFMAAILIVKTVTADPADYEVVVVTDYALMPQDLEGLEQYMASCAADLDGDGKVEVSIENLVPHYTAGGDSSVAFADQQKLTNYLATGDKMLFVFDRISYDVFSQTIAATTDEDYRFFAPLHTTADGYDSDAHHWCWSNDLRRTEEALADLPEDLLFGVRTPQGTAGQSVAQYENGILLIEALIASSCA